VLNGVISSRSLEEENTVLRKNANLRHFALARIRGSCLYVNRKTVNFTSSVVRFVSDRLYTIKHYIIVASLPDNIPAHQAMLRQVEISVGRPQTLHGNVHQVDHVPNGPTNSAAITTMFPLRHCGGKLLVAVTRERRYTVRADYATR